MTEKHRVFDALTHRPQTPKHIGAKVGLKPMRVAALCQQLVKEGRAVHKPSGYRLPIVGEAGHPATPPPAAEAKYAGPPRVPWLLEPGIYLYSAANVGVEAFAEKAKAAGFTWVAFLVHEGNRAAHDAALNPALERRCRAVGLHVAAWGPVFGETDEGTLAAQLSTGYDAYIINAEAAYKLSGPQQGENHPEFFARADVFAADYRVAGGKPGGISTLVGADIHFRPLISAGLNVVHPQCYVNEIPSNTPAVGIARAVTSIQHDFPGWAPEMVAPTIGSYGSYPMGIADYAPLLRAAGCQDRYNQWAGEFLTDGDLVAASVI